MAIECYCGSSESMKKNHWYSPNLADFFFLGGHTNSKRADGPIKTNYGRDCIYIEIFDPSHDI